ncbi:DUF5004 domain-containing protein [Flavobacteriaceae bacterium LMO-SS05]
MKNVHVLLGMLMLLLSSCDLGDNVKCPDALTGGLSEVESDFVGVWDLIDMVAEDAVDLTDDNVDNPSTNIYQQFSECKRDLVYDFKSTRAFTVQQGYAATNCSNKQIVEGTWKLETGKLSLVSLCTLQSREIVLNTEKTEFTRVDQTTFSDVNGLNINTKVTLTFGKRLP